MICLKKIKYLNMASIIIILAAKLSPDKERRLSIFTALFHFFRKWIYYFYIKLFKSLKKPL